MQQPTGLLLARARPSETLIKRFPTGHKTFLWNVLFAIALRQCDFASKIPGLSGASAPTLDCAGGTPGAAFPTESFGNVEFINTDILLMAKLYGIKKL